ncbi:uncharacterized protein LACBIDRAFT_327282 [Laccaria bicolor S238N-H82]|uniref:Predicted protein n=1 Tax=Laccaria bicolor (strain S238N-H82 / ATCC MYA-4686) TaxID=486041 RepID=B0DBR2_LACBS|nr:uncharacterized protein LACBIDRAFT_327282 [Laccaria bicolor S238N-H82]EDR08227.1 predicted protein [Laccaria bicolor S238N-H82]|eukprot:XP_001881297.1 predicted protein [Laccaria bicolor S238N-H82]
MCKGLQTLRGTLHTSTTNKHFSFSTTTIHIDDHPQPRPTTPPSATTAVRRSEPPSHTSTTTTTWQRHISSPTADGDLARQRTCHVVQTVTTQSSSLPTLVQVPPEWMTGDGDDLACQRAPNTMKSDECPAPPLEPRCYVAVSNVATKRRTTANSSFVVVIHLMTHRLHDTMMTPRCNNDTTTMTVDGRTTDTTTSDDTTKRGGHHLDLLYIILDPNVHPLWVFDPPNPVQTPTPTPEIPLPMERVQLSAIGSIYLASTRPWWLKYYRILSKRNEIRQIPAAEIEFSLVKCGLLSEAAYASFLFDSGPCEACGNETVQPYASFALRLRLCPKDSCMRVFLTTWPTITPICRRTAWTTTLNEYENMTDRSSYAEICADLYDWFTRVQNAFRLHKKEKEAARKGLVTLNGWDFWDMMNCTVYGPYHKHKNRIYEQVGGVAEAAHRKSREEALQHHSRLRSAVPAQGESRKPAAVSAFLKLPVLDPLQSPGSLPDDTSVSKTLKKDPFVTCILEGQVAQWTDKARQDFGVMFGYPAEWKSANKNIVHPAERLSARYLCKKCKYFPTKYRDDECLDFAGACAHQCVVGNPKAKKNGQAKWTVPNFKKDDKASAALKQLIAIFGHDNQKSSAKDVLSRNNYVLCVSCDPPLYVCTAGVAGHSHRHEEMKMQIAITGYDPLVMGAHDVERGLDGQSCTGEDHFWVPTLLANFEMGRDVDWVGGRGVFCHLTSTTGGDDTAGAEQPSDAFGEEEKNERKEKQPKLFSFNGFAFPQA